MSNQSFSFTDRALAQLPLASKGQYMVRDRDLRGFYVVVGTRKKTFVAQAEFWQDGQRKGKRLALGGIDEMSVREARIAAKGALAKIASGEVHRQEAEAKAAAETANAAAASADSSNPVGLTGGVTLRQAWERYRASHMERKGRSEATIEGYEYHVERLFADWLDKPLSELGEDPGIVADRHDEITRDNGPGIANGAMRTFRAIYNHARKRNRDLPPENPTLAVDWNVIKRRDTAMGVEDLPSWFAQARSLRHPIRRELHLFTLLSASRPAAILRARLEHLNIRDRVLHVPRPKGGEDRAFDIPLSRAMVRCLVRAMRASRILLPDQAKTWIFAGESRAGHMTVHRESRDVLSKFGNDLRQTFRTVGQAAGLSELDCHLLMNHSLPGVNAGYITRAKLMVGHLRKAQEEISQLVMSQSGADGVRWPVIPSRKIGDPLRDPTPPDRRTKAYCQANPLTFDGKPRRRVGRPPGMRPGSPTPSQAILPTMRAGYPDAPSPPM
ncbi:MAG TPA: integrase family protein [Caulobacter sp.]|nr:integrase family protein [Caulobacter sp.]HWW25176.1 integrase family protein [Caulobacter sp.]